MGLFGGLRHESVRATWYVSLPLSLMPYARPTNPKFFLCIKVKSVKVSRLRYREAAGLAKSKVRSFVLIELAIL